MILVDSSVWIDYFNDQPSEATDKLDSFLGNKKLLTGDLILTEVLEGFKSNKDYAVARSLLISLEIRSLAGQSIALKAAENYRSLRKNGITIRKTIDSFIATYCIEHDLFLLQSDKDFLPFSDYLGLQLI
ncbi:PIN domain nuclease [Endozoicomonas sp. 4G]|uniref:type II toxin-antitoxin system VapC family toxin n=1 Tax=Endozoicomonas sp. 4G TaxID=2872754 RepID=UPI002078E885|nr:PIN domain nuclease [Endozoicomonas sp. 4G]